MHKYDHKQEALGSAYWKRVDTYSKVQYHRDERKKIRVGLKIGDDPTVIGLRVRLDWKWDVVLWDW